jgi:hypothetical protein
MLSKRGIFILTVSIFIAGNLVYFFGKPQEKFDDINIEKILTEVVTDVKQAKNSQEITSKHKKVKEDQKRKAVKIFITGLVTEDQDIFLSSFHPKTISKDLFNYKEKDKSKITDEIIRRINRNGQLKHVKFSDKKGWFHSNTNKISLIFIYADQKNVKITLETIKFSNTLVINSSSRDIIKQIEKQL